MQRILPRFTATNLQASAYLAGIALFSIAFLVFLNATISFVITDVIGQRHNVGNDVGNLGFADELVALVACPLWGLLSDRIGVRWVAVAGYVIVGLSLVCLVQSAHIYPDLIIWRMVFSIGAAACTTMVTAVLPAMTARRSLEGEEQGANHGHVPTRRAPAGSTLANGNPNRSSTTPSVSSELTITPTTYRNGGSGSRAQLLARERRDGSSSGTDGDTSGIDSSASDMDTSRLAGFVGMFTGIGALIALVIFLPLPATLGKDLPKALAVQESFYIVGAAALLVAIFVGVGLRNLPGEEGKSFRQILSHSTTQTSSEASTSQTADGKAESYISLLASALALSVTDARIALGYTGGFVARASSVGVSLFIPLFVNAYYIRSGQCDPAPGEELKSSCQAAFKTAAMLSGVSQLAALLAAPLYGHFSARWSGGKFASRAPIALAAVCGIVGNAVFGSLRTPDVKSKGGHGAILAVILIGLGQIGAIVCSLGILAQGIHNVTPKFKPSTQGHQDIVNGEERVDTSGVGEEAPLLLPEPAGPVVGDGVATDRAHLKGTIAGVYSLAGGAAILLLTKLGGHLFDTTSAGAPFFLLAGFNALLLVVIVGVTGWSTVRPANGGQASRA